MLHLLHIFCKKNFLQILLHNTKIVANNVLKIIYYKKDYLCINVLLF